MWIPRLVPMPTTSGTWSISLTCPAFRRGSLTLPGTTDTLRSVDGGTTWAAGGLGTILNATTDGIDNDGNGVIDDPGEARRRFYPVVQLGPLPFLQTNPTNVFVGLRGNGPRDTLYESTDAGATWTNLGNPKPSGSHPVCRDQ